MVSLCSGDHNRIKLWIFQIFIQLTQNKITKINSKKFVHCLKVLNIEKQDRIILILICILQDMFCLLYKSLSVISACQCILSWQLRNIFNCYSHDVKVMIKIKICVIIQGFFTVSVQLIYTERIATFPIQLSFYIIKIRVIFKLCLFFFRNNALHDFFLILIVIHFLLQWLWKIKNCFRNGYNLPAS